MLDEDVDRYIQEANALHYEAHLPITAQAGACPPRLPFSNPSLWCFVVGSLVISQFWFCAAPRTGGSARVVAAWRGVVVARL